MEPMGWVILGGVALFLLYGMSKATSPVGGTESGTGARLFDSTIRNSVPVGGAVAAIKQPNGHYYCPTGTQLWKDIHTGRYACVEPSTLIGAPNSPNVGPVQPGSQIIVPTGPGQSGFAIGTQPGAPQNLPITANAGVDQAIADQINAGTFVGPATPTQLALAQNDAPVISAINNPPPDLTALLDPLGPSSGPPPPPNDGTNFTGVLSFNSDPSNANAAGDAAQTDSFGSATGFPIL